MIFKHGLQQQEAFMIEGHRAIWGVLRILDALSNDIFNAGEIVITDALRKPRKGKRSFHPIGQAVDIRTNNRSRVWKYRLTAYLNTIKQDEPKIQYVIEDVGKDNEHLHIEFDTGDPV